MLHLMAVLVCRDSGSAQTLCSWLASASTAYCRAKVGLIWLVGLHCFPQRSRDGIDSYLPNTR